MRRVCPECGLAEPDLSSFPAHNPLGAASLVWATRNRRPVWGASLHCPRCGALMTLTEELERLKRTRST